MGQDLEEVQSLQMFTDYLLLAEFLCWALVNLMKKSEKVYVLVFTFLWGVPAKLGLHNSLIWCIIRLQIQGTIKLENREHDSTGGNKISRQSSLRKWYWNGDLKDELELACCVEAERGSIKEENKGGAGKVFGQREARVWGEGPDPGMLGN